MFNTRKPPSSGDPLGRDPSGPLLLAVYIALLIGVASAASAQQPSEQSDALLFAEGTGFSDHWILNADLSEDLREKMMRAMQAGGGGRGEMARGFANATELVIVHEGNSFIIRTPEGSERKLTISEQGATEQSMAGRTAYWDGSALVVVSTPPEGGGGRGMTERYKLVVGARRLVVTMTISPPNGGDPISVRRVFDAAEGS
jgi:hypothetical protein